MSNEITGNVLIAGGTGLIGTRLCRFLLGSGWKVRILTRGKNYKGKIPFAEWDPSQHRIPPSAFDGITHVINLAGASIAGGRWTENYKEKILQSRLDATQTLKDAIRQFGNEVKAYVGASAVGYYGNRGDELLTENSSEGNGFLSSVVTAWEAAASGSVVRTVLMRNGLVLTANGGALPPMARPVKSFIAPVIDGNQFLSWIHIDDLCALYMEAMKNNSWSGVMNAVAPESLRYRDFMKILKKVLNPKALTVPVPVGLIKLILGEQSTLILDSTRVQPSVALKNGFQYKYADPETALRQIYAG